MNCVQHEYRNIPDLYETHLNASASLEAHQSGLYGQVLGPTLVPKAQDIKTISWAPRKGTPESPVIRSKLRDASGTHTCLLRNPRQGTVLCGSPVPMQRTLSKPDSECCRQQRMLDI
ncbi:hypothetical protein KL918_005384 [Ogataea parapolymorpha]|nr:hypothetical protein KL918_005384 [Ogataea parapolymorpha]KAG7868485.1 hypothetical protein KL916_005261 [Ogataea parapolymorpha]